MKSKKKLSNNLPNKEFKELTDDQLQKVNGGISGPQNKIGYVPPNYDGQTVELDLGGTSIDRNF